MTAATIAIAADMDQPHEVELKLRAPHDAVLDAVLAHNAVQAAAESPPSTALLVSRYYDTPDAILREAGVALRLRSDGTAWVQCVKGGGSAAGVHDRLEFESPVPVPRLDRTLARETPWAALIDRASPLRARFTTRIRRTSQPLALHPDTRALLCIDRGVIVAGMRSEPVCEVEIELVAGDVRALIALARVLTEAFALSVAHASKAERGYRLLGAAAPPRRARRVALAGSASAAETLVAVGNDCLAQVGANLEAIARGHVTDDVEHVHQLRVGVRRLRSLLRFARSAHLDSPEFDAVDDALRWLGSAAGEVRDRDVFAGELLMPIAAALDDPALRRSFGLLRARATRDRAHRRTVLIDAVRSPRANLALLDSTLLLADFAAAARPAAASTAAVDAAPGRALAVPALEGAHRKLRKRGRHLAQLPADQRHRARIAAKRLRYATEFFSPLFAGGRATRYLDALTRLQDRLGRLNDLVNAASLADQLVANTRPVPRLAQACGIVHGWCAAETARELRRLRKAWRGYARQKPFWS